MVEKPRQNFLLRRALTTDSNARQDFRDEYRRGRWLDFVARAVVRFAGSSANWASVIAGAHQAITSGSSRLSTISVGVISKRTENDRFWQQQALGEGR